MEVDKSNFRSVILSSVNQLNEPLTFFNELNLGRRSFNKVLICGMGGSAIMGEFLSYFQDTGFAPLSPTVPVLIHRSYNLPMGADQNTLVICISYSGNTEETIAAFDKALAANIEVSGITSGGQMAELFQKNKIPWVKIPQNIQPRMSSGYQLSAIVKVLMAYGLLGSAAQAALSSLPEKVNPSSFENQTKLFCAKLHNKVPIIYTSQNNFALAMRWKISFNENTKIPAFCNVFPEMNHNEMVGWTRSLGPFHLLFLRDSDDLPRIKKRMEITAELLKKEGLPADFIDIAGQNPLEKIFWALVYGNWLSYYLALMYGIDPTPVAMVEELKKKLKE
ncbi:MAG TPA: bifunctional phosphoglucose/phosphomannose isomerase [Candidatus Portnoybacteria bacterium]|nr:bifunctional phosphoglucose/phosphomannose isomerase [Candidatus Portnoybacteria bacterium]